MKNLFSVFSILASVAIVFSSCSNKGGEASSATGWKYNDAEWGGFEKKQYEGQIDGPNLVLIEGGTFTMGQTQDDIVWEYNYTPRRVTVSSFYMDETEVTNSNYREYLWWLKDKYYETYPEVYRKALPDTLVWRDELTFNEPYVETYFRHPAYDDYPVVGVSWLQATDFCKWRSNRVNEMILVERGILNLTPDSKGSDVFDTKAYLSGQYQGSVKKNLPDIVTGGERPVMFDDGILLPDYRLPTEAEWEFAALALPGNQPSSNDEVYTESRFFPWNHNTVRYKKRTANQGRILANFKRGEGDYMGVSGNLNDNASFPGPVRAYFPNDFGLYNMAGNVNEWVLDVYRATTSTTLNDAENHDLNPYRGNKFKTLVIDENGNPVEKDSLGSLKYRDVTNDESKLRENYQEGDVIAHEDGDADYVKYLYGESTLVSDKSRVYKGGSWSDRLYWLQPGTRRYKDEDKSDRNLGFRCAMVRVGGQAGNEDVGGNTFQEKGRNIKRRYK